MVSSTDNYSALSEYQLITGMQNDDQGCFFEIYGLYSGRLFGFILKWVKEYKDAEKILCHAFTMAWNGRSFFKPETEEFYHWLCRQARLCYHEHMATAYVNK